MEIFRRYKLVITITNSTVLNKLQSYSRISAVGPESHCTSRLREQCVFHVGRMWTTTRGEGESGSCGCMWTGEGESKI